MQLMRHLKQLDFSEEEGILGLEEIAIEELSALNASNINVEQIPLLEGFNNDEEVGVQGRINFDVGHTSYQFRIEGRYGKDKVRVEYYHEVNGHMTKIPMPDLEDDED